MAPKHIFDMGLLTALEDLLNVLAWQDKASVALLR